MYRENAAEQQKMNWNGLQNGVFWTHTCAWKANKNKC